MLFVRSQVLVPFSWKIFVLAQSWCDGLPTGKLNVSHPRALSFINVERYDLFLLSDEVRRPFQGAFR